ncbi:MAG TPA: cytochrome ubiquinol oxidase subunit I [Albitalea sp.]|uniref:cytochrome ubiquinol oxidase subunit I n=1 Tax=Piscinibacter sp. TaxID=1903157 RepID=UPI002ED3CDDF
MDAVLLARAQFAANMSFHILFPTVSIALGWMLLFFRWRWLTTHAEAWLTAYRFWTKVFALTFALGVVSGITMSFQFGTNWPGYMEKVGNIAGPLLGYEVLTAFFLEASFLGIMLFGHGRVSERLHFTATFLVALGTTISAFWILCLDSWMQTPVGYEIRDGVFHVTSWLEILGNPSFPYRLTHMLLASTLTVCFLLAGLSAWQLLRGAANASTGLVLRVALTVAAVVVPVQILVGDLHGLNTLHHQPQKIAAMEAIWETERGAPLLLFAWPDEAARTNRFAVAIPRAGALVLTHDTDGEIKGLNDFPDAHPPVAPLFFGFRVMVGTGVLMLLSSWAGWWIYRRRAWAPEALPRPLLWMLTAMTFSGWLATLAGWYVTEIGRQPFIVYGLLRTADVASKVPSGMIASTLALYVALYIALITAYVAVLKYMAEKTPEEGPPAPQSGSAVAHAAGGASS